LISFFVSTLVVVIAYIRIRHFRCPRCKNYFSIKHSFATIGRKCVHCGLSAYASA
jgi:hypothetical protein